MKESSMERLGVLEGKFNAIRRWKGGIRGIMERLDALEGKFNEKMTGKVGCTCLKVGLMTI